MNCLTKCVSFHQYHIFGNPQIPSCRAASRSAICQSCVQLLYTTLVIPLDAPQHISEVSRKQLSALFPRELAASLFLTRRNTLLLKCPPVGFKGIVPILAIFKALQLHKARSNYILSFIAIYCSPCKPTLSLYY